MAKKIEKSIVQRDEAAPLASLPEVLQGEAGKRRVRRSGGQAKAGSGALVCVSLRGSLNTGFNNAHQLLLVCMPLAGGGPVTLGVPAPLDDRGRMTDAPISPRSRAAMVLDAAGAEGWQDLLGAVFRSAWKGQKPGKAAVPFDVPQGDFDTPVATRATDEERAAGREVFRKYLADSVE